MTEYEKGRIDEKAAIMRYLLLTRRELVGLRDSASAASHIESIDEIRRALTNNAHLIDPQTYPPFEGI